MSIIRPQIVHTPTLTEAQIDSVALLYLVLQIPGVQQHFLWDSQYWFVSHEDWGKVFQDILLNLPTYIAEKFDCDNFALVAVGRVSERYRLNSLGLAIGQSPLGYHAWNIFCDELGLHYLEPQTGMVYEISNLEGYRAEIVILG